MVSPILFYLKGALHQVSTCYFWLLMGMRMRGKSRKKFEKKDKGKGEKNRKEERKKLESMWCLPKNQFVLVLKSDLILVWWDLLRKVPKEVLVEVLKVYKEWCNSFLWRTIGNSLRKKAAAPYQIGRALINLMWITVGGLLLWSLIEIFKLSNCDFHVGIWFLISTCYICFSGLIVVIKGFLGLLYSDGLV